MRLGYVFLAVLALTIAAWFVQSPVHETRSYGEARIGGTFHLTDTHGRSVSDSDFRGKLMLVYMGYSHCPDICPMTLATISETLKALGPDAEKVAPIFISLDPERDTPQVLASFLSAFDPRITGLTGGKEAIDEATKAYRVYSKKVPTQAGNYLVDHSGFLYLMDGKGKYIMHFESDVKPPALEKAIRGHF